MNEPNFPGLATPPPVGDPLIFVNGANVATTEHFGVVTLFCELNRQQRGQRFEFVITHKTLEDLAQVFAKTVEQHKMRQSNILVPDFSAGRRES